MSFLVGREEKDTLINFCGAFRQIQGEQRDFLLSSSSQLFSIQNKLYARVAYFGNEYCPSVGVSLGSSFSKKEIHCQELGRIGYFIPLVS